MKRLQVDVLPALSDNYIFLIHHPENPKKVAVVDPGEAPGVQEVLQKQGLELSLCLLTHHHHDHVGGVPALKKAWPQCQIWGAKADQSRLPDLDRALSDGMQVEWEGLPFEVLDVRGHTAGHIAYYFPRESELFCGDTLFLLGCGRLFEGSAEDLYRALKKIAGLPKSTRIFCAHEYTLTNASFALSFNPSNPKLNSLVESYQKKREQALPTVPGLLKDELEANPFLRPHDPEIAAHAGLEPGPSTELEVFTALRRLRDRF